MTRWWRGTGRRWRARWERRRSLQTPKSSPSPAWSQGTTHSGTVTLSSQWAMRHLVYSLHIALYSLRYFFLFCPYGHALPFIPLLSLTSDVFVIPYHMHSPTPLTPSPNFSRRWRLLWVLEARRTLGICLSVINWTFLHGTQISISDLHMPGTVPTS